VTATQGPIMAEQLTIVPANEASWDDLRAIEAYPMITQPGKEVTWGELHVGARQVFEDAGFKEVSHPTPRRVVMRIDFPG
jgi:hypothetical protein